MLVLEDEPPAARLFLGTPDGRWCFATDVRDDPTSTSPRSVNLRH